MHLVCRGLEDHECDVLMLSYFTSKADAGDVRNVGAVVDMDVMNR